MYNYVNKIINGCKVSAQNRSNFIANRRKFIFTDIFLQTCITFSLNGYKVYKALRKKLLSYEKCQLYFDGSILGHSTGRNFNSIYYQAISSYWYSGSPCCMGLAGNCYYQLIRFLQNIFPGLRSNP